MIIDKQEMDEIVRLADEFTDLKNKMVANLVTSIHFVEDNSNELDQSDKDQFLIMYLESIVSELHKEVCVQVMDEVSPGWDIRGAQSRQTNRNLN